MPILRLGEMVSDSFKQAKSQVGRRMIFGALLFAVGWVVAGSLLPSAAAGLVRVVLVVALLGGAVFVALRMGGGALKRRRADLAALAMQSGFGFEATPGVSESAESLKGLNHFALFAEKGGVLGKRPDAEADAKAARMMDMLGTLDLTNRVSGTMGSHSFQAFDFRCSPDQGARTAQRTTVFLIALDGADLPAVRLTPRASVGALGSLLAKAGGGEIELVGQPDFKEHFILRGSDEPAIEALFSLGVVGRFDQLAREFGDVTVEAAGDQLLLYRFGALAEGGQFDDLLSAGARIADALAPR